MNEIKRINPEEFGLEKTIAEQLTESLTVTVEERKLLIDEFKTLSNLEITIDNVKKFKELRLKIAKNRTQGIIRWHKNAKNYFLRGGQFVDAIKRKEIEVNEQMESKLLEGEKYFENLEKQRLEQLQNDRVKELSQYIEDANERDLSSMDDEVWEAYLAAKKKEYKERIEAEKKAELDRLAKEKAEREEQERIRKENERLKKEAEIAKKKIIEAENERKRLLKIEAEKLSAEREKQERIRLAEEAKAIAKLEKVRKEKQKLIDIEIAKAEKAKAELEAKIQAEKKAELERLAKIEDEANKGDAEKVNDLINDLNLIKTKYGFKSNKNKKMMLNVSSLIDKIVSFINNK